MYLSLRVVLLLSDLQIVFLLSFTGESSQLDDLYTSYRQRLRKSLFISGLNVAFVTCLISIVFCTQVRNIVTDFMQLQNVF